MIAEQGGQPAGLFQGKDALQDAGRIRSAIDIVAERDDVIIGRRLHGREERVEGAGATVDVADDKGAHERRTSTQPAQRMGLGHYSSTASVAIASRSARV